MLMASTEGNGSQFTKINTVCVAVTCSYISGGSVSGYFISYTVGYTVDST